MKTVSLQKYNRLARKLASLEDRLRVLESFQSNLQHFDSPLQRIIRDNTVFGPIKQEMNLEFDQKNMTQMTEMNEETKKAIHELCEKYHKEHHPDKKMIIGNTDIYI